MKKFILSSLLLFFCASINGVTTPMGDLTRKLFTDHLSITTPNFLVCAGIILLIGSALYNNNASETKKTTAQNTPSPRSELSTPFTRNYIARH